MKGEMRQFKGSADLLSEKNGMVMMNNRLYIPKIRLLLKVDRGGRDEGTNRSRISQEI